MTQPYRYDEVPYTSHAYPDSHPDRLACVATLFGLRPPDLAGARVLEIGCAAGGNLIPMAYALPEAELLGVDLSAREIEEGQQTVRELGLEGRVTLRRMDLLDLDASFGKFDYIVCHGIWSWVPWPAQEHIFRVCRENLAENGVAYVSYNTYPGWRMRGMIRDMMLYHVAGFDTAQDKLNQARALLQFLAKASPEDEAHGLLLRAEVQMLQGLSDSYLYHDHLSDTNEPVYFHQFAERALSHGLKYLGEPHLAYMVTTRMPDEVQQTLAKVGGDDIIRSEQYLDFVKNRTFRQTLLVHREVEIERALDWRSMTPFWVASPAQAVVDVGDDLPEELVVEWPKDRMTTREPLLVAAFLELGAIYPRHLAFEDLLARARERSGSQATVQEDREMLGANLLTCYASGGVYLTLLDWPVGAPSERPLAFPVTRLQVERNEPVLTTVSHSSGRADALIRELVRWCDGTRDRAALVEKLADAAEEGRLRVRTAEDEPITDRAGLREAFAGAVDDAIANMAHHGFLLDPR